MGRLLRKPLTWVVLGVVVAGLVVGLALFEPWRAFTSSRVDEALPVAVTDDTPDDAPENPPRPAVLAEGKFATQEHATTGTARVLQLPDGSRVLRLESFSTSDGPDVHVWLATTQAAGNDWHAYDDGRHVPLGELKATDGNHNYAIPANADLDGLRSAVIWCDRFNVAFGSAPLVL